MRSGLSRVGIPLQQGSDHRASFSSQDADYEGRFVQRVKSKDTQTELLLLALKKKKLHKKNERRNLNMYVLQAGCTRDGRTGVTWPG